MFIGNLQQLDDILLHPLIAAILKDFVATNADVLELPKGKTDLTVPAALAPADCAPADCVRPADT